MHCYQDTIKLIKLAESRQPRQANCPKALSLVPEEYPLLVCEADPGKIKGVPFELQGPFDHRASPRPLGDRASLPTAGLRAARSEQSLAGRQPGPQNKSIDLKKGLSRAQVQGFLNVVPSEGRFARSYNPSYKTVERRLDKLCLPFAKTVGRDFSLKLEERSPYNEVLDHLVKNQGKRVARRR